MKLCRLFAWTLGALLCASLACWGQGKRKVIVDQDAMGPAGTDCQSILLMVQSPDVDVLGITIVTGDQWRDEEMAHTLRLLELIGRTDIPVLPGAEYPLVRRKAEAELWEQRYGHIIWMGAWTPRLFHPAEVVPPLPEGQPTTKASSEDAAHFMIRMVHKYPHQVTIWEGGPMTNLALAISLDPEFPKLAKELVFMAASLNPETDNPEFAETPRQEFNFYFDPEAAHIVLRAHWAKIVCTPVDISVKTHLTAGLVKEIAQSHTPAARYMARYARPGGDIDFLWDELSVGAWLDPGIITREETRYMDVDISHGAGYGNTLTWTENYKPQVRVSPVQIQMDLNHQKFYQMFVHRMSAPTPPAP
jgi:inosine-uridine nucleoside N-ribohydrolase